MLFSEIYGTYFHTVAAVLSRAAEGAVTGRELTEIVRQTAFGESALTIPASLRRGDWPLLRADGTTPLGQAPTMPLTTLEKQWLKALLADPRIRLFAPAAEGLEDVEPLYAPDTFVYFDRYGDGDPFDDDGYVDRFRTILTALREGRKLKVWFRGGTGIGHSYVCIPWRLEYSPKDDKFRLFTARGEKSLSINLARISVCRLLEPYAPEEFHPPVEQKKTLVLELTDERNALERAMLHFSDLEKETVRLDDKHYRVTVRYLQGDETELLIRILSFGPVLRLLSPPELREKIRQRLEKQALRMENGI